MAVAVGVLVMVSGVFAALAALAVVGWVASDRSRRVTARGGVVGRESRGVLLRDGDRLVFVRRARRYVLPLLPEPDQAVRRTARPSWGQVQELTADGFCVPDHVVHTVAATGDDRRLARLVSPDLARSRVTARALVPTWAAAVFALGVVLTVPWLGVWFTGVTIDATVTYSYVTERGSGCGVTWADQDRQKPLSAIGCADTVGAGSVVPVRALASPFDGTVLALDGRDRLASVVGLMSVVGLVALLGRAVLTVRRRAVTLWPMVASVPGFDRSGPNHEQLRVRQLSLYDLAVAVQRVERHGDVEDNDLFRSHVRALWRSWRGLVILGLVVVPMAALYLGVMMQSGVYAALTASVMTAVFVLVVARERGRMSPAALGPDGWRVWDSAVAWRRLDGPVSVVLFDVGGAVWSIPVDRVFAPGATVEVGAVPERGKPLAVRANGVALFTCGPAERVSRAAAIAMRQELVYALLGPEGSVPAAVR